ncbi:MAG: STAS domain-containing protein [Aliidiomarina sp.]|uniref:STAS domain-containing protein n=1 Tax=Aliidiomarina sp. TaxID=1872439 RepID=UPI0025BCC69B|nr:STAS domain-containing protein [Aliidiomarina sp.]MCH8501258.1 STAS domain-containing protein [Aliidiomarina sp.]
MNSLSFTQEKNQVVVRGLLDRDHVGAAWQSRQDWLSGSGDVSVDLQGVEKVDSAGLAMLIQVKAELLQQGRELALHNVNTQLRQFAEVSGVTELLSLS